MKSLKATLTKATMLLLLFLGMMSATKAQTPTYELRVTNEVLVDPQTYQFDVYLLRTGANPFQLSGFQFGLGFDVSVVNGGTLSAQIVAGNSELLPSQEPLSVNVGAVAQNIGGINYRFFNLAARAAPGAGNGTIISDVNGGCTSPGTRVGRFRLVNSVPFTTNSQMNHVFSTSVGSGRTNTIVSAYIGATNTNVTTTATHLGYNSVGTCLTNITLNPPAPCDFDAALTASTNVNCFGGADGSATITLSGVDATASGTYSVNGGAAQPYATNPFTITGLAAGAYSVVVTNGTALCTSDPVVFNITQPVSALSASVTSQTNVACFGGSTGSVTITATGGTAPYTGDGVISGLAAGTHNFTVTDANGCTFPVSATITEPASAVVASSSGQVNVLCFGQSTGSVTISGSGGTAPYTGEGTFSGLAAGTYNYTVTDANGCTDVVSVTITEPTQLVANESHTQAACGGFSDVTITASGGTAPYSGEGTFQLAAGATQTYTVTDANGCTAQVTVTATVPGGPSASITAQTNVSCFEGGDGSATVTATGGLEPYTYSWSPSGGSAATATGLAAGTYTVTVTDANNCSTTASVTITEPADLTGTTSQTNVSCFGGANGTATVNATGGTGSYSYSWSPSGGTAATATGLAAGAYSVTVTDANGCTETFNFTITEPASAVDAVASGQVNVSCFGGNDGSVTISGSGGTAPYTGEGTFSGLAAGTYNYTVTDANGCTDVVSVTITEPTELVASESHTPIACGGISTVTISATGGTGPYTGTGTFAQGAGTQNYTVTDANGCTDVVTVTVTAPGGPTATITAQTNVDCNGNATGSATVTAADGLAPYTYSWSPSGGTAATATGLAAGTYTVTVTDANNCSTTASVTITEPAVLVAASSAQVNVSCNGGSDGSVTISATGGTSPYTGTGTFTGLAAGTYNYTVTDANGCTDMISVTITEPSELVASSTQTNVTCNGGSDGTATITATGGTGPYTGTGIFTGLAAGTYNYTVTDANGCTDVVSVTITEPAPVPTPTATVTQPDCFTPTGVITVTSSTAGLSFSINGSDYTNTTGVFNGVAPGTYSLTAKDGNGCVSAGFSVTVDPQPATPPAPGISATNNGNGTFTLTANGYTGTLLWSTSETTPSIIVSPPGTFTVTQTVGGCTSPAGSYTLAGAVTADPAVIGMYFTDMADAGINANTMLFGTDYRLHVPLFNLSQSDIVPAGSGYVTINLGSKLVLDPGFSVSSAGLGAYFTWSTSIVGGNVVITGTQIANIPPDFMGEAVFTVEGALSCAANVVATWTIDNSASSLVLTDEDPSNNYNSTQYGFPVTITATPIDVTCNGAANGDITWVASPGTSVIVRNASNQVVTAPFGPGTYTVTASANNDNPPGGSCSNSTTVTINEPATAVSATATGTPVSCFSGANGTATANPAGGTGPYTYSWNTVPVQTTQTATGLVAGTYTVTVTDANGCSAIASFTVTQPTALTASASGTNVNCNGGSNGTATVVANGGTPIYTYSWNTVPVQTTATATGLAAGTYTVTVTDANGCSVSASYTVTEPATGLSVAASGTNVDCFGNSTGTASAAASGGTAPYSYSWNTTPVQTTQTAVGLPAGTYTVTVTDANGCTATDSYTVTQSAAPLSATASGTNVSCFAGNNGTASVVASGGTAPYTYSWNTTPVQTTSSIATLPAGSYTVTVTDANGCSTTATYVVTQPTLLTSTGSVVNVSCNGGSNGSATVVASGGTPVYSYSWNTTPVQTTATATGLAAGTYTVTITDANGCTRQQTFTVTQPAALGTTANITNVTCNGLSNGSATVIVSGGTAPYSYSWNTTPVQTTATATGLAAGTYTVTVTDVNGCVISASYNVTEPAPLTASAIGTNVACFGSSTGTATALPVGGTAPYTYSWNTVPAQTTATATGLAAGTYTVTVTDANGCTTTASYTVTESGAALSAVMSGTDVVCFNAANGTATATVSGGTAPYSYAWNTTPVQTTSTATGLAPGTYSVTITDANGCSITESYTVNQPANALSVTTTGSAVNCFGNSTGTATANPVGGTGPYTYSWNTSPVQTTQTATGLAAGSYTVTVTDANGCSAAATYVVTQPSAPLSFNAAPVVVAVVCNGGNTGSIAVSVAGGTAPYSYTITGGNTSGASSGSFTGLVAGTYVVTVTDAVGCQLSTSNIVISQPTGIWPDITLGSDYTANFFASNGVEQTIVFNVAEIGGNPAIGDTIRIIKPSGYTFTFDNLATSVTVGATTYTLDNTRWKIDNSNPSFVSLILDPLGDSQPGILNCGQLVRVSVKITRNTPNISTFTLSSRLRRCGISPSTLEQNLSNNLNSIIFTAE